MFSRKSFSAAKAVCSAAGGGVLLLLFGCANPGPPRPPSLHLPALPKALAAERVGKKVELSFTVPAETTDGGRMKPPLTAVLCRVASFPAGACKEVGREPVSPGPSTASDTLPEDLASGAPRLLEYRIQVLNVQGHGAGESDPVYAAAGAAPLPIGPLSISPLRNAALITWRETSGSLDEVRIERTLISTADGPVKVSSRKKAGSVEPETPGKTQKEVTLASDPSTGADKGGLIDRTIHDGDTVTYVARRVRQVTLSIPAETVTAKKGGMKQSPPSTSVLEIHGEPSAAVAFTFHDTLPPVAPTGLAAIAGGGFGQPPSIDLSWEANPEDDLAGYNVFRVDAAGPATSPVRLNASPVPGPSYRDLTAQPGHIYRYFVTAIDQRGNVSTHSAEVTERLIP